MSAADFRRMYVAVSILLEGAIILPKNKAGEDDSLVPTCASFQTADVLLGIRCIAHNQKTVSRPNFLESLNYEMSIVFRLKPRDIQNIAIWLDPPLTHGLTIGPSLNLAPISDHR